MAESNSTTHEEATGNLESMEFRIIKIILYVLILILSCVGNSLVAFVILRARGMRTSSNLLILNLAICDFITPTLSIPFDLAYEELHYVWPFGKAMCKVLWPFQTVFSTSSSLILAAISVDRFRTLVKPLSWHISLRNFVPLVLTIHAFSICLCAPYFVVLSYNASEKSCHESWLDVRYKHAYTIGLFLCQYALPLIIMSIAYILIYHSLRSNLVRLFSMDPERRSRTFSTESTLSKGSMDFRRKEQNIRLAKMFVIVVVVFAISMFPNQILWIWIDFENGMEHHLFHYISVVCRFCTYANSVFNPFIYALKSKEFRSGFAKIGRTTVTQPLRKLSSEARRFVRKVSGSVLDNQRPIPVQKKHSACGVISSEKFEAFQLNSPTEVSRDTKLKSVSQRKISVPRRKFSCYEITGDIKRQNDLLMELHCPNLEPIQEGISQEREENSDREN